MFNTVDKKVVYVDIDETICYYDEPLKDYNYGISYGKLWDGNLQINLNYLKKTYLRKSKKKFIGTMWI